MVETSALLDAYRETIVGLRGKLQEKDLVIKELNNILHTGNSKTYIHKVALKLACVIENPCEDNRMLVSIISNLINNQEKKGKTWNDDTKNLFAIILDYGGPALAKIVTERLSGPSLRTIYRTAKLSLTTPSTLSEDVFKRASLFYGKVGYDGPFLLAVDATALAPSLKAKGNQLYGLAVGTDVVISCEQDIIDHVHNSEVEKAKQANVFVLAPLQEHVPSFVLAIAPVVKGQDHLTLVERWYSQSARWSALNNMFLIGLGADGDSKCRKYYNNLIIIILIL
jgi:hypothetical protein